MKPFGKSLHEYEHCPRSTQRLSNWKLLQAASPPEIWCCLKCTFYLYTLCLVCSDGQSERSLVMDPFPVCSYYNLNLNIMQLKLSMLCY